MSLMNSMSEISSKNDREYAMFVCLVPNQSSEQDIRDLFTRGFDQLKEEVGTNYYERSTELAENFAMLAFREPSYNKLEQNLVYSDPGVLSLVATFAGAAIKQHTKYAKLTRKYTDPNRKLLTLIERLWVQHFAWFINNEDKSDTYRKKAAKVVTNGEELTHHRIDNYGEKVYQHLCESFQVLFRHKERRISETNKESLFVDTPEIRNQVDRWLDVGNHGKLFEYGELPTELCIVLGAIDNSTKERISYDTWLTDQDIYEAVHNHWEHPMYKTEYSSLSGADDITEILSEYGDHNLVHTKEKRGLVKYKLYNPRGGFTNIHIKDVEDILELPCYKNLDDFLHNNKPSRWHLYSIARLLLNLNNEFTIDDVVNFYRRYPWFSENQIRLLLHNESTHGRDGEISPPKGCENDSVPFDTFCIGLDNCEYSIYDSLPLRDEV